MPPHRPLCTSAFSARVVNVSSISPRREMVSPGTSVLGFSQSVSTITSASNTSGKASI